MADVGTVQTGDPLRSVDHNRFSELRISPDFAVVQAPARWTIFRLNSKNEALKGTIKGYGRA